MGTLKEATYAAMLDMFLDEDRVNEELVRHVCEALRSGGVSSSTEEAAFRGEKHTEWLDRMLRRVVEGEQWSLLLSWKDSTNPRGSSDMIQYAMDRRNPDNLLVNSTDCLRIYTIKEHMPPAESPRIDIMVETFKHAVKAVQPRFAFVDLHNQTIKKRGGVDPRRFVWGAMYYGPGQAQALGIERLRACSAVVKEEWSDGSFWIQADANPFSASPEAKARLARELGLKGPPTPSGAVPAVQVDVRPTRKGDYTMPVGAAVVGRRSPQEAALGVASAGRVAAKAISILIDNERVEGVTLGEVAFGATPRLVEIPLPALHDAYKQTNARLRPMGEEARLFLVNLGAE